MALIKGSWENVINRVNAIESTENSYYVVNDGDVPLFDKYSANGLSQLGSKIGFPAAFLVNMNDAGHLDLVNDIITARAKDFFDAHQNSSLLFREFADNPGEDTKIHGVLTNRYSIFDDIEVSHIIESSDYLMNAEEVWFDITPDQFHARFISPERLHIPGDTSDLSMCVFIDNSMVGKSMFKIRFGIYRWACTNGMISNLKEFSIVKERHLGIDKSWEEIVAIAISDTRHYEQMLLNMIQDMNTTRSSIYGMSDEDAVRYIKDKLNTSTKTAVQVIDSFKNTYGGETRWGLCNAITDTAHSLTSIDARLMFEERAMRVA